MTFPMISTTRKTMTSCIVRATLGLSTVAMLSACGGGSGGDEAAPVSLGAALPDEGDFIAIVEKSVSLSEASRHGTIQVTRLGSAQGETSVSYSFIAGSAQPSDDFRGVDGILSWDAGESGTKTVSFIVESDLDAEPAENFHVELSNVTGSESLGINDRISVTIEDATCNVSFPLSIGSNTQLNGSCYHLQGDAVVASSAQLNIPAGTTVIADAGTSILFDGQSSLNMEGTPANPVVVKSAVNQPGSWNGFKLQSSSALHRVAHSEVSGATNAFELSAGGFALFNNNVLKNHTAAGVKLPLEQVGTVGGNNEFLATVRGIELTGSSIDAGQTLRLPAQSTHYVLADGLVSEGTLELGPGTDLHMAANVQLLVLPTGAIKALGTVDEPITIRGLSPNPGFWNGIQYVSSTSDQNQFQHVQIAHGGGDPARPGNIIVDGLNTRITMQSCEITHSAGYGLVYDSNAFQVDLTDVTFDQNELGDQSL